jgi:hypothetical protein
LRAIAIFGTNVAESLRSIYKQAAAGTIFLGNHPTPATVLTNHEYGRLQARRRFSSVFHLSLSPLMHATAELRSWQIVVVFR